MKIDILTLFPNMVKGPLKESILKRAQEKRLVRINVLDIRSFTHNRHRTADDAPYGGGAGMVLKPEPIFEAVESIKKSDIRYQKSDIRVILLTPQGERFNQGMAKRMAKEKHLIFICGHYEGIDERVKRIVTDEISIGDYVLTGGELASLVVIDALVRLIPGVLGKEESIICDSFYSGLLDYPHYTRPEEYRKMRVPSVLLSGNHERIARWRRKEALRRTLKRRPDLLEEIKVSNEDKRLIREIKGE
ncbi:tRNA (guanosine(37)-N1)-methyltransferase TrmD [bacterium]|nr:tRNA (guanosine(37)-N1)-methyltransferase TrmD [bacterium]